ncbi:MAG: calcium-binding protein, partial [Gaiellales bacterium]
TIRGDAGQDVFWGDAGDDTLESGGGNDTIHGGDGTNQINGAEGDDLLTAGAGDDAISGEDGDDVLIGGAGADQLNGGNGTDWVDYSARAGAVVVDLLDNGSDGDVGGLDGTGDDIIDIENVRGGQAGDTLKGDNLDNTIDGGPGADSIDGDGGTDTADYSGRSTPVSVDLADGLPDGGVEDGAGDTLSSIEGAIGGDADDTLLGSSAPNTLSGGPGNDLLNGRLGADYLVGGTGLDTADYSDRSAPVTADLDGAADDGESGEGDRIETDVESLVGGTGPDVLVGNNGDNILNGGAGDDTLDGALGADSIVGGPGVDTVEYVLRTEDLDVSLDDVADDGEAGEGDNVGSDVENVSAGAGDDVLLGSAAANLLVGGPGDDLLDGGLGADVISGGIGVDVADYSSRTASVVVDLDGAADDGEVGEGDNVIPDVEDIVGGAGADSLRGSGGPNHLQGGGGGDTLDGLSGSDFIEGGDGPDTIQSQDGTLDTVMCGSGADTLTRDPQDLVTPDCESVSGGGGFVDPDSLDGSGGLLGAAPGFAPSIITPAGGLVLVGTHGTFRLRLKCPKSSKKACRGKITLKTKGAKKGAAKGTKSITKKKRAKALRIGSAKYKIKRGKKKWVKVKLTRKGKALILEVRKLKATVVAQSGSGKRKRKKKKTKTIVLKAPKTIKTFPGGRARHPSSATAGERPRRSG